MTMTDPGKHIHVSCAIIEHGGLVLAARRGVAMSMPLKWELPGGKVHDGESPEGALHRELDEELGVRVSVKRALPPHTHRYPAYTITLYPFVCAIIAGRITLHEHAAISWLRPPELYSLDWVEADPPVIEAYLSSARAAGR